MDYRRMMDGTELALLIKVRNSTMSATKIEVKSPSVIKLYRALAEQCMVRVLIHLWSIRNIHTYIYRVSQEEYTKLRESVPYVKVYRYNPKHLCRNLNGYGDNGQRSLKL